MILTLIFCAVISFILFYVALPPINFQSVPFWVYLIVVLLIFGFGILGRYARGRGRKSRKKDKTAERDPQYEANVNKAEKRIVSFPFLAIGVLLVLMLIFGIASSHLFRASDYAGLIRDNVVRKDISEYTPTIDNVPLMDRYTAELLASRTMGSLVEEVSQFDLGRSIQINYKGKPVRVVPLEYAGFFKWINNRKTGIPSFISVDMKTQKTEIHTIEGGMTYTPSGYFGEDLRRHLRFRYPTVMMSDPVFEIDENGNPYWVVSKLKHRVGLFGGTDVDGILIVDAVTGRIDEYGMEDIPLHVDNAISVNVLLDLYNDYGAYQGGFWNSRFGQKNVVQVTEGYNYIPKDDDIYLYTGVTSVVSDESNIGFIFVNMRTKEYEYYEIAGAEEFSAMASAEGVVQHLSYKATFPLLLSIEGQPTYCVALKDAAGLVKMYGLVNMSQYQIVVTGNTIDDCLRSYRTALKNNGQTVTEQQMNRKTAAVEDIRTGSVDGTTVVYVRVEGDAHYYAFTLSDNQNIILANVGERLEFEFGDAEAGSRIIPAFLLSIR